MSGTELSPGARAVHASFTAAGGVGEFHVFAEPVPTAAAAAERLGCQVGAIANSLIFSADGEPLLVLASGAHRVDVVALAEHLQIGRIRRASADFVAEHTGQLPGGVGPVGHPTRLRTVIDRDLAAFDELWAGGGDEFTMVSTNFDELVQITGGQVVSVA